MGPFWHDRQRLDGFYAYPENLNVWRRLLWHLGFDPLTVRERSRQYDIERSEWKRWGDEWAVAALALYPAIDTDAVRTEIERRKRWHYDIGEPEDRASAVFQALGAASVCWEHMSGTGIFDSDRARQIGEALLVWLGTHEEPLLGVAPTRQLLDELATRMEITQNSSAGRALAVQCREALDRLDALVLDYRTVGTS